MSDTTKDAVPLKRFLYNASIESAAGWQTFYIDADTRDEADERARKHDTDGIYTEEVSVEDLGRLTFDNETTLDDFGDFPPTIAPAQVQAEAEPVAEVIKWRTLTGHTAWDFKVFDKTLEHGAKLYTSPQPSPTAVVLDDERNEREAFEHWMTHDYGYDAIDMQTHQDGVYILSAVHEAWEGWQGARAALPQPVAQPVEQTELHICGECDRQFKTGESAQPVEQTRALTVTPAMVKAAMPWLTSLHHMRKTDKESYVEEAIKAAMTAARPASGETE